VELFKFCGVRHFGPHHNDQKCQNPTNISQAGRLGRKAQQAEADRHANNVLPVIRTILSQGSVGMVSIAEQLNQRGIRTSRGGSWHASSVVNVLARAKSCDVAR
jgi:hypothetical protein